MTITYPFVLSHWNLDRFKEICATGVNVKQKSICKQFDNYPLNFKTWNIWQNAGLIERIHSSASYKPIRNINEFVTKPPDDP